MEYNPLVNISLIDFIYSIKSILVFRTEGASGLNKLSVR